MKQKEGCTYFFRVCNTVTRGDSCKKGDNIIRSITTKNRTTVKKNKFCFSSGSVVATMLMVFDNEGNADVQLSSITTDLKDAVDNGTFSALGDIDTNSIATEKYVGKLGDN